MNNDPSQPLTCYNHPDRETSLRCNRCERPICPQCAVLTPTGYRCKACVRGQQKIFETTQWYDYPLTFILAGLLSFLGSLGVSILGFFTLFLAPVAGVIIAESVRFVTQRRRSKRLFQIMALSVVLGSLPLVLINVIGNLLMGGGFAILPLIWQIAYTILVTSSAYYRLSGIQIRY
jgi:hypothetical protein